MVERNELEKQAYLFELLKESEKITEDIKSLKERYDRLQEKAKDTDIYFDLQLYNDFISWIEIQRENWDDDWTSSYNWLSSSANC